MVQRGEWGLRKSNSVVWSKWRGLLQHNRCKAQQPGDLEQSLLSDWVHWSTSSTSLKHHLEATTRQHKRLRSSNSLKLKAAFFLSTEDLLYSQSYSELKQAISLALMMAFLGCRRTSQERREASTGKTSQVGYSLTVNVETLPIQQHTCRHFDNPLCCFHG